MATEEEGFPPVVFTYNVTACTSCHTDCQAKFAGKAAQESRIACKKGCRGQDFCVRYQPAEFKPVPVKAVKVDLAALLIPAPAVAYQKAEMNKPDSPRVFFKKLREYIAWKDAQDAPPAFQTAEDKPLNSVLLNPPAVCLECIRSIAPAHHKPEFGDVAPRPAVQAPPAPAEGAPAPLPPHA